MTLKGTFGWSKPADYDSLDDIEIILKFELTSDEPFDPSYETFIGWGLQAKNSREGEYILYEAGVVMYQTGNTEEPSLSMY